MRKKIALITGASRGIGKACAIAFAKAGYALAITCQSSEKELLTLAESLTDQYSIPCLPSVGDISNPEYIKILFSEIMIRFGQLDILINNAGISYVGLTQDMEYDRWNQLLNTNVTSAFLCCKEAIPHMLHRHCGSIVNVSSIWGITGASCETAYSASKGALNAFTKALGKELAPSGIRVNAIALGAIETTMNHFLSEKEYELLLEEIPMGRFATSREAADLILDIAINHPYLTAQIITMDGGWQ